VLDLQQLITEVMATNAAKQDRPPFYVRVQQDALDKIAQDGPGKVDMQVLLLSCSVTYHFRGCVSGKKSYACWIKTIYQKRA